MKHSALIHTPVQLQTPEYDDVFDHHVLFAPEIVFVKYLVRAA